MEVDFGLGIGARISAEQKRPSLAVTDRGGAAQSKAEAMSTAMEKGRHHQAGLSSPRSAVFLFSRECTPVVKTENEFADYQDNAGGARKKLRLTKGQSALLEDKFKEHTTLSPNQKHALAKQLNLQPRQVEVWFQNKRARTKVKQTQEDCELLRKCCESLTEENRRLHKELQELECSLNSRGCRSTCSFQLPPSSPSALPAKPSLARGSADVTIRGTGISVAAAAAAVSFMVATKPLSLSSSILDGN